MTAIDPNKLAETLGAATPGPWWVCEYDAGDNAHYDHNGPCPSIQAPDSEDCAIVHWDGFKQEYWSSANGNQRQITANAALISLAPTLAADWLRLNQLARDLTAKCAALDAQVAEVTAANALLMDRDAEARWLLTATPHDAPLGEWAARGRAYLGKAGA